jgi:hypothetical protein
MAMSSSLICITIPAKFGLIRFRGFRREELNMKVNEYDDKRQVSLKRVKESELSTFCVIMTWLAFERANYSFIRRNLST